ncbi:hypothetical protein [Intestinirhabdus alba]|jgi:hypothetical protein|uniref:Uncharacterized protein n=1 Tax=Intestinirhabdus alba TaxID=2899544 RepID=A0A6L6IH50_9ENTR|nr:hypothetical protein [Intestinirhabdus alba]MTH46192.1 hypothetical protein [Intestinirhabdus alba]
MRYLNNRFAVEKDDPSEAPESGDKPDSTPQKKS